MSRRIRFVQLDVPYSTVHGPDGASGFPLPDDPPGSWEPFQVEIRTSMKAYDVANDRPSHEYVTLAIWLREKDAS